MRTINRKISLVFSVVLLVIILLIPMNIYQPFWLTNIPVISACRSLAALLGLVQEKSDLDIWNVVSFFSAFIPAVILLIAVLGSRKRLAIISSGIGIVCLFCLGVVSFAVPLVVYLNQNEIIGIGLSFGIVFWIVFALFITCFICALRMPKQNELS